MRFIHTTYLRNLDSILKQGIKRSKKKCIFADVLFEDLKNRYNDWGYDLYYGEDKSIVAVIFSLPSDQNILVGDWIQGDGGKTSISVGKFEKLLSKSVKTINKIWIKPINEYDILRNELRNFNNIKVKTPIGKVIHYYSNLQVAVIKLEDELSIGDKIEIEGFTTKSSTIVDSIQIENQYVKYAFQGQEVGIKVLEKVRRNDLISKIDFEWNNTFRETKRFHYPFISSGFEVRIKNNINPKWILGYYIFETKDQFFKPWYTSDMF